MDDYTHAEADADARALTRAADLERCGIKIIEYAGRWHVTIATEPYATVFIDDDAAYAYAHAMADDVLADIADTHADRMWQ